MPPRPKSVPKAKPAVVVKSPARSVPKLAGPPATRAVAAPPAKAEGVVKPLQVSAGRISPSEAQARLLHVEEAAWHEQALLDDPPEASRHTLRALLLLLEHPEASSWDAAAEALRDPPKLLALLRALGPSGCSASRMEEVTLALHAAERCVESKCESPSPAATSSPALGKVRGGRASAPKVVPSRTKAPTPEAQAKAAPSAHTPSTHRNAAILGLKALAEALVAQHRSETPAPFPMVWPLVPYEELHVRLQQALAGRQTACVICSGSLATKGAVLHLDSCGAVVCDVGQLQLRVCLTKTLSTSAARSELGRDLREAMSTGRRLVLLMGDAPPNLRYFCDSTQVPIEAFDGEKIEEVAKALELSEVTHGFHMILVVQSSKARAEQVLPHVIPSFDEMAVLVLDTASLPSVEALNTEASNTTRQSLHAGLRLLTLPPSDQPLLESGEDFPGGSVTINQTDFEFVEAFGDDWEQRWLRGPARTDEGGKLIREGLIKAGIVKYPSQPKDAKQCLQLVGGALNAPCTGVWTSFVPLVQPTEVEFEFTVQGKMDLPNACVVFTERAFEGALPDCKVGVHFTVRGGMQLSGGGNLVKISNDGKIQSDKWNKVLLRIDWTKKIVVAQVDTRGKGYAPAVQTVPFRDTTCAGFGFLYIYNTDVHGTCWIHSLRVKQNTGVELQDTEGLDAAAHLAARLQRREYQRAVDADMENGMKMGAINATKEHGMNLAQEQAANNSVSGIR